jgi:lysophospholipase L1-like esterase
MQRTILCYGDSNTWGYVPSNKKLPNPERYPRSSRWTGLLQNLLGEHYYVVEEGLNSRTTNLDYHVPPDRNGKTYLPPCLYTHAPIDLVILALGGNDLKAYFNRSPEQVRDGLAELVSIIQTSSYGREMLNVPDILILSPPTVQPVAETFLDEEGIAIFAGASEKARKLVKLYAALAKQQSCYFLDISEAVSTSSTDGLHFDVEGHRILSHLICEKIKAIYE